MKWILMSYPSQAIISYLSRVKAADKSEVVNGIVLSQYNAVRDRRFSVLSRAQIRNYCLRWVLLSAAVFISPREAIAKKADPAHCYPAPEKHPDVCEPDLFKKNDQIFSGSVEFLYWGVLTGGLDYALQMQQGAWGPTASYAQGNYENGTYQFDPGFRLSLLYFRAPHYWESKWQYTRMTNRGKNNAGKPSEPEEFLTGTWPQTLPEPLSGATSHLHFNYNVFDWFVDRVFFPNPHLRLRVMGGASAAWMDQDWKVRYNDAAARSTTIRNKWQFIGGGLKTGTAVDWYWTGDLYMTAQGFFGVLLGTYSNHSKQTTSFQPTVSDNPDVPIRDATYRDIRATTTFQMALGPSFQRNYPSYRIEAFAGFEMNTWANLNEIYRSTAGSPSEAKQTWVNSSLLTLYGLTTRLTVDF